MCIRPGPTVGILCRNAGLPPIHNRPRDATVDGVGFI